MTSIFRPNAAAPITSEMLRQDFIPDYDEVSRFIHLDSDATETDKKIALGTAATCVVSATGVVALAGFTAALIVPVLGIGIAGISAWNYRVTLRDRELEAEFISDHPEILQAVEAKADAGEPMHKIANAFDRCLRMWRQGERPSMALPTQETAPAVTLPIDDSLIENPESTAPPIATPPQVQPNPIVTPSPSTINIIDEAHRLINILMDNPYQSRAIIAGQRTGKTYGAACATYALKGDGTEIFYINLFDHGQGNREAFAHANCVIGDLDALDIDSGAYLVDDAIDLLKAFKRSNDAILVVDEWMTLGGENRDTPGLDTFWKILGDETSRLCSNGVGNGRAIWGIAPFFKAGQLRNDAKLLKQCEPIVISISPGQSVPWTNPKSGKVTQVKPQPNILGDITNNWGAGCGIAWPSDEQAREWRRAGVLRVYWAQGKWWPVGELPALPSPIAVGVATAVESVAKFTKRPDSTAAWGDQSVVPGFKPSNVDHKKIPDIFDSLARKISGFKQNDFNAWTWIDNLSYAPQKEAMKIAYGWVLDQIAENKHATESAFMDWVKAQNCDYLAKFRDAIWSDIQSLIDIPPPPNPATHCGLILWAQLDKRMKAGDPTAFAAGKAISDLMVTDRNAALTLAIKSTCKDRAQLEALCGTAYGFLWPS